MKYVLLVLLFIGSSQLFSQCDGRYENVIFDKISKISVVYSETYDWSPSNPGLEMDIYTPSNDIVNNRPLLIFAHGGVYIEGDKNSNTMVTLCEEFAKRGYVTASIRYRLTNLQSLLSSNSYNIFSQTVVNSISDMKSAVRYFRKDVAENNNTFGINPNLIFVGGYSAGAVTAAHLSVIDEGEVPDEFLPFFDESGGIEGNSGNFGFSSEVSGAILLAGAINTTNFLDENDPPIVSVHSTDDNTIDYECASPLGNLGISLLDLPVLCGSGKIHDELDNIGIINDLYTFSFGGHSAPIINLEGTVVPFISDFLHNLICQSSNIDVEELPLFSVYPNPCQNYINIENVNKIKSVVVIDMLSNIVTESKLKPGVNKINISELSRGVYFIYSSDNISLKQLFVKN
tara:strand:- start:2056 stop:3258 length:1203 start_codon:yes stop_codon:yes gene_type:complete